jgi:hypothetical protein
MKFRLDTTGTQYLLDNLDEILRFSLEVCLRLLSFIYYRLPDVQKGRRQNKGERCHELRRSSERDRREADQPPRGTSIRIAVFFFSFFSLEKQNSWNRLTLPQCDLESFDLSRSIHTAASGRSSITWMWLLCTQTSS